MNKDLLTTLFILLLLPYPQEILKRQKLLVWLIITYVDFRPLITKVSELVPLSVVTADKAYDSEKNHELVRDMNMLVSYQQDMTCAIMSVISNWRAYYIKTQNRELSFRCIEYNIHRLTNLIMIFRHQLLSHSQHIL
jgi:hypothetical protein